ncbi:hypothetical protein [Mannheimia haemolytica]|uniref:hypothetical protein n=1 Tax=Mannheimia haemolytica TaxID=75985 RepID=UPI000ABD0608|nr:hypothetical protein [Mannheimia haemolytica]
MAKNYIQDGNTVRLTATKAITSGDVIVAHKQQASEKLHMQPKRLLPAMSLWRRI